MRLAKIREQLWIILFFAYSSFYLLIYSSNLGVLFNDEVITSLAKVINIILFIMLIVIRLGTKYDLRWNVIHLGMLGCISYSAILAHNYDILITFLFIITVVEIDFEKIIRIDIFLKISILVFIIVLYKLNIIGTTIIMDSGRIRNSLGFLHPNTLGIIVLDILAEYVYLRFKRISVIEYVGIIFIVYVLNIIASPRSSIVAMMSILILVLLLRFRWVPRKIFITIPVVFFSISYFLVVNYAPTRQLFEKLNILLSGRLFYINKLLTTYKFKLFGQSIPEITSSFSDRYGIKQLYLDNGYLDIVLTFGIIVAILALIYLTFLLIRSVEVNNIPLIIMIIAFCAWGLMENKFYLVSLNISLLAYSKISRRNIGGESRFGKN